LTSLSVAEIQRFAADRLRDLLTSTFDVGQWLYKAGHVITPPPSLNIIRLSVLEIVITYPF